MAVTRPLTNRIGSTNDLFITLVDRRFRLLAKRSFVGIAYPVLAPVFLFLLYLFVFHRVFRVSIAEYPIYLFAGLLPWTFIAQTLPEAAQSISSESDLIRNRAFGYELLPIAAVSVMMAYFLVTLAGFLVILAAIGHINPIVLPVLIVPIVCLYLLVATIGLALAVIDVYNHDVRRFLANLLTIWFFVVPIVYGQTQVQGLIPLRYVDPANIVVSEFRAILYYRALPAVHTLIEGTAICFAIFALAIGCYRRLGDAIPRDL